MIRRTLKLLCLTVAATLALAAPSYADATAEVGMEDGGILLGGGADSDIVAASWKNELGVDVVRIQAFWDAIAPSRTSLRPPVGFTGFSHTDSRYNWEALDNAVKIVRRNGMAVMITISQKGPRWGSRYPLGNRLGTYYPDPLKFSRFAGAVARRYGSQVNRYLVGNEPNQSTFQTPQNVCRRIRGRRVCSRVSPHHYRALVNAAYPAIKRNDRISQVLIGEMAPIGGTSLVAGSIAPLVFLKEMGCLNFRFARMTTGPCVRFRAPRGDAFGYHPYSLLARRSPFRFDPNRNLAALADMRRFFLTLDGVTLRRRILAPRNRFNVYLTEYGYETRPPDPRFGLPLSTQSTYLQQAAYVTWATPRVKNITQYLYRDDPDSFVRGSNVTFQTGLAFSDGSPKTSLGTFPHPFHIASILRSPRKRFWGQVKPGGYHTVLLQRSIAGGPFNNVVGPIRTNYRGYWSRILLPTHRARYRYVYGGPTGDAFASDVIYVP